MAGKKKSKAKKKNQAPDKLGLLGLGYDEEIDVEDMQDYLQDQLDEHIKQAGINEEIVEEPPVEEPQTVEQTASVANNDEEDPFGFGEDDPVEQNNEQTKAPQSKNFFDMEGDDLGEIVEKKPLTSTQLKEKRPVMSDFLTSVLEEETEEEKEAHNVPTEKENPFEREIPEPKRKQINKNKASAINKEYQGVNIVEELENEDVISEADEDDEIDAVYEVEETVQNINENETEKHTRLRLSDFYKRLDRRLTDSALTEQVKAQLSYIFQEAGITNPNEVFSLTNGAYGLVSGTMKEVPMPGGQNPKMHVVATQFFKEAYDSINDAGLSAKNKIIAAQKIADLMLKNYSVIAFVKDELDEYADNYMLNNSDLLKEALKEEFEPEKLETLIQDLQAALEDGLEFDLDENEVEAPNQEPVPQKENDPEQINVPVFYEQLKNNINNKDLTEQVKKQISDILKESGVEKKDDLEEVVGDNLEIIELIEDLHVPEGLPEGVFHSMHDIAKSVFTESYGTMERKGLTPRNKLVTAQRITDVILKSYSPVTFANGALDKYADNYIIQNRTVLKSCLRSLQFTPDEIHAVMQRDMTAELEQELEEGKKFWKAQQKTVATTEIKENPEPEVKPEPEAKNDPKPDVEAEKAPEQEKVAEKKIDDKANVAVFMSNLNNFNKMYKLNINADAFAASVTDAWTLMKSGDKEKMADGTKEMNDLFKDTLKKAFDIEKDQAYHEHRLPEYVEIIKSSNELLRAGMYAFTDLYHDPKSASLFNPTAFGGLDEKEMAKITAGKSLWSMDQKSDAAWEIQSKEAKNIADQWLKEDRPYEKMIRELNAMVKQARDDGFVDRKERVDKLTAAEWLLINNEKMMVEDPEDPLNPIPNWGNRYWKALTEAREALGIDSHTSMRDIIQNDYAASAKAVNSRKYNERQIYDHVVDPDARAIYDFDSMETQKEAFATQSADVILKEPEEKKTEKEVDTNWIRVQISVNSENEFEKMKNEPKVFSNITVSVNVNNKQLDEKNNTVQV